MLQPEQFLGRLPDEGLDGVLVAQPVAAGDGVVGVFVEAVSERIAPAAPPSAETVWLRIGYTLETTATSRRGFVSAIAIAALRPAPPPPTSTTS
jgi:hypothetical protein